jgi:hypothetical protein
VAPDSTIMRNMNALADNIANIEKQFANNDKQGGGPKLPGAQYNDQSPAAVPREEPAPQRADRLKQEKEQAKQARQDQTKQERDKLRKDLKDHMRHGNAQKKKQDFFVEINNE